MKTIAVTALVLALGLAACQDNAPDDPNSTANTIETEAEADLNAATNDSVDAANAADNALDAAGNVTGPPDQVPLDDKPAAGEGFCGMAQCKPHPYTYSDFTGFGLGLMASALRGRVRAGAAVILPFPPLTTRSRPPLCIPATSPTSGTWSAT